MVCGFLVTVHFNILVNEKSSVTFFSLLGVVFVGIALSLLFREHVVALFKFGLQKFNVNAKHVEVKHLDNNKTYVKGELLLLSPSCIYVKNVNESNQTFITVIDRSNAIIKIDNN